MRRRHPSIRVIRDRVTREPVLAGCVALATGVVVYVIATTVFPYHSSNHDEAVYLSQAALLLEGQLELHAGDLAPVVRPWFYVQDGGRLYPRYAPVPAAVYALAMGVVGEPRVALAAIAAGNVALIYLIGSVVFDRRVGLVAGILLGAAPLTLITGAVFLPYATSTFFHLIFILAYLVSVRDRDRRAALIAGLAIGVAFFARPFTALLLALPFIAHAGWQVLLSGQPAGGSRIPDTVVRHGLTAAGGVLFVGITLAYNAHITGDPLTFPFEAFAPFDRPGFGYRQILGHSLEYTPVLALRANAIVLETLLTQWLTGGVLGSVFAGAGLGLALTAWGRDEHLVANAPAGARIERTGGLLLAGLLLTVPGGNLFFWGNRNILGAMGDPTDGIIAQFGPFYHFDLLIPLTLFGGVGVVCGGRQLYHTVLAMAGARHDRAVIRGVIIAGGLAVLIVTGGLTVAAMDGPLERSQAHTEKYERVYGPIATTDFQRALVFTPTPYGEWLHHPFQWLRNEPGLDGPVVYAMDRGAGNFALLEAYPNRTPYRFAYRGEWVPSPHRHVTPILQELQIRNGHTLSSQAVVSVPERVEHVDVRIEPGTGHHAQYAVEDPDSSLSVNWTVSETGVALTDAADPAQVPVSEREQLAVVITLVHPDGATLTYRLEAAIRKDGGEVAMLWPPERFVCPLVTDCGSNGRYVPADTAPAFRVNATGP